jgi:hypothetical protein
LKLTQRERAFERLRRRSAVAIKIVIRTKDPITLAMSPLLFPATLPSAAGIEGLEALVGVGMFEP